ncbi:retrovirus-related pol polyprotein from transposon TNT 1-94 [Tanacetum coccineum]
MIKPGMYQIDTRTTQTRASQFPMTFRNTNPHVTTSTGVIHRTSVSRPQLKSTQMKDKVVQNNSQVKSKKTEVEDHHRISSISNKTKSVTACNDSLKVRTLNVNVVCVTCGKCVFNSNHDACVSKFTNDVNARTKKPKLIMQLILFIVDSGCIKHMTGNLKLLYNFVEKYLGTVRFRNDQFAPILGYGDLVQGNITIKRVYYVECLNHNLFSVGQFCDADLEVAFCKPTCFVRDLQRNDLLTGNWGSDLYTISLQKSSSPTRIYFLAKASPTKAWLWHQKISHLNFDTINLLSKNDILNGLPKLKYAKDQLVYNKRTRLIVESIHINFDEIKDLSKASDYDNSGPVPQLQTTFDHNYSELCIQYHNNEPSSSTLVPNVFPPSDTNAPSLQELEFIFSPLFEEYFTAGNQSVSKSSSLSYNSTKQNTQPAANIQPTTELITPTTNVNAEENNNDQAINAHIDENEFYNIFSTYYFLAGLFITAYLQYRRGDQLDL